MGIYHANSYADLPLQKKQWADCEAAGAQAFIIAAISADGLNSEIARAMAERKVVIDLINGVNAETTSRAVVSFADMASQSAEYMLRQAAGLKNIELSRLLPPKGQWLVQQPLLK